MYGRNRPVRDTCVPNLRTCEILRSSITHGGRPYTVQRRGMDAGEREEPPELTTRGVLPGTGPEQTSPHAGSSMAPSLGNRAAVRALPHNTLPGTRNPRTLFLPEAPPPAGTPDHAGPPASPGPSICSETQTRSIPDGLRQSGRGPAFRHTQTARRACAHLLTILATPRRNPPIVRRIKPHRPREV